MKLLHRTTRDFLAITIIILIITGFGLYFLLQKEVMDEMDEQLGFQAELVSEHLRNDLGTIYPFSNTIPTTKTADTKPVYGDTLLYDRVQSKYEDYHYLNIVKEVNGKYYEIQVMSAYIGWERYYKTILFILLAAIVLLAGSGVAANYFSARKIWKPFFLNLEQLKKYSVSHSSPLQLSDSPITELQEMQRSLRDVTDRSHREFIALREFTENASHEIQTPLGIIQSKLDRLSQLDVTEEMAQYIVQAKSGVERLSKMNRNLLLLAKLDNRAFEEQQEITLNAIVEQHLSLMEELFSAKSLAITKSIGIVKVNANHYLCEVLLSNLLSNALRYSKEGAVISITLGNAQLMISNEGTELDFPPDQLFNRFQKSTRNIQTTGLGLAIVKQICMLYGWEISYEYVNKHIFRIKF